MTRTVSALRKRYIRYYNPEPFNGTLLFSLNSHSDKHRVRNSDAYKPTQSKFSVYPATVYYYNASGISTFYRYDAGLYIPIKSETAAHRRIEPRPVQAKELGTLRRNFSTAARLATSSSGYFMRSTGAFTHTPRSPRLATIRVKTKSERQGELQLSELVISHGGHTKILTRENLPAREFTAVAAEYIYQHCGNYRVLSHGMFRFDFPLLREALIAKLLEVYKGAVPIDTVRIVRTSKTIAAVTIKKPCGQRIQFLDSHQFLPAALTDIFSDFLEYGRGRLREPNVPLSPRRKNEQLLSCLATFNHFIYHNLEFAPWGSFTLSSMSRRLLLRESRNLWLKCITYLPSPYYENIVRAAYRGGRTAAFKPCALVSEEKEIRFIDVASLYPAVAYYYSSPAGAIRSTRVAQEDKLDTGVYRCHIYCPPGSVNGIPYLLVYTGEKNICPTNSA